MKTLNLTCRHQSRRFKHHSLPHPSNPIKDITCKSTCVHQLKMVVEDIDDSCRRPGSVPFKWEIEPGIPRYQTPHAPEPKAKNKLNPPPAGVHRFSESFPLAKPKLHPTRSELRLSTQLSSKAVDSPLACAPVLPFLLLKPRKALKQQQQRLLIVDSSDDSESSEPDYASDLETLARWSNSNRKSLTPFLDSPSPSSSPRSPVDAEWAAFGLF